MCTKYRFNNFGLDRRFQKKLFYKFYVKNVNNTLCYFKANDIAASFKSKNINNIIRFHKFQIFS